MDSVILDDFRCFAGRHEVALAPLTVLVGENSTGKSSFLAGLRLAWDLARSRREPDFNEEPFLLGAYEQIANYRGGAAGRAKAFTLGGQLPTRLRERRADEPPIVTFTCTFASGSAQPVLVKRTLAFGAYQLTMQSDNDGKVRTETKTPSGSWVLPAHDFRYRNPYIGGLPDWLDFYLDVQRRPPEQESFPGWGPPEHEWALIVQVLDLTRRSAAVPRPYAFAPIRSRPKRTYDPIKDTPDAEGQHIPMVLAQALNRASGDEVLSSRLRSFGHASGLFSEIAVKQLGNEGNPFQVLVKTTGPRRNLMDVGYGVSQVLPIIVELMSASANSTFLIQQPEVHLHPRAQAELATLLLQIVKTRRIQVVVETHSDFMIDRLRMEIATSEIDPATVGLLYFESLGVKGSRIHSIPFDDLGNLSAVPYGYRQFFLDEQRRFLTARKP